MTTDTNLFGLDCESDASARPIQGLVSVAIAGPSGRQLLHQADPNSPHVIRETLREASTVFGANLPNDVCMIVERWPDLLDDFFAAYERDALVDVLSSDKLIVYAEGAFEKKFGLAAVVQRRCGVELAKGSDTWRMRYGELMWTPVSEWPAEASEYALKDAAYHLIAGMAQRAYAGPEILAPAAHIARKHFALHRQGLIGLRLDPDAVAALDARLTAEIDEYIRICLAHGLAAWGGTKKAPKVVCKQKPARGALEALGIPLIRTDPTDKFPDGQISLSEDALKAAKIPAGHPLDAYRRLGARTSQRTKFVGPRRGKAVVYTKYDELKITGRTGSASYSDDDWRGDCSDNLQNQAKETDEVGVPIFRICHIPRPGHVYVGSDWGGAELVTLAQVQLDWFGSSALATVLNEGRNPHEEMACTILNIDRSRYDKHNPEHKDARQLAKIPNFGLPGGLGPKRLVDYALKDPYNRILTLAEAKRLRDQWLETWPEMRMYFAYIDSLDGPDGITITGPRFSIIRGGASYTEACNFPFQGLAAAAAGTALWRLLRAGLDPASPLFGSYQVLFVHDENLTESPEERAEAAMAEQDRIMIEAFGEWCPDVRIKVDSKIMHRYEKT